MSAKSITYIPRDSYEPGNRSGVQVPNSTAQIGLDGVHVRRGVPTTATTFQNDLRILHPERELDATVPMQIAVWNILESMRLYRMNLENFIKTGTVSSSSFEWKGITYGIPEIGQAEGPLPWAAIVENGECNYEQQSQETDLIDDTTDAFEPGTVLRRYATATQSLAIYCLSAHKEERRGIKSALESAFLAEPDDDKAHRRVLVPQYYNRTVRLAMGKIDYADDGPKTQADKFELVMTLDAEVEVVRLVSRPMEIREPQIGVRVSDTLD